MDRDYAITCINEQHKSFIDGLLVATDAQRDLNLLTLIALTNKQNGTNESQIDIALNNYLASVGLVDTTSIAIFTTSITNYINALSAINNLKTKALMLINATADEDLAKTVETGLNKALVIYESIRGGLNE